jgi:hypothetical protein
MTKHHSMLLALFSACALTLAPNCASAQVTSPTFEVGPGPYDLDLDVAAGDDKERFLQAPAGAFAVRGFIQFIAVRSDAKWAPLAAVEVMGPHDSYNFGLIAFVLPKAPDKIEFAVRDVRLQGLPTASFGRISLTNAAIPFELHLDRSGVLQVSVLGKPGRPVSIRPLEITRVRVLASTAHIRFSNIEITASDK